MADLARQFVAALNSGRACLHPTDTLPGLTFDPLSTAARDAVTKLKGRGEDRPYLALACSLAKARRFFQPFPAQWDGLLEHLWPGPLSVVWTASKAAPKSLIAADGTIGIRVPSLPVDAAWFRAVLELISVPLPTTSVNRTGEPAAQSFAEAVQQLSNHPESYVPSWLTVAAEDKAPKTVLPSTVIRLHDDGSFQLLRRGALAPERLAALARQIG